MQTRTSPKRLVLTTKTVRTLVVRTGVQAGGDYFLKFGDVQGEPKTPPPSQKCVFHLP